MKGDLLYSVALSLLLPRSLSGVWEMIFSDSHEYLYDSVVSEHGAHVQDHIRSVYGSDPLAASEKILQRCAELGVRLSVCASECYPPLLKEINRPPVVLYYTGTLMLQKPVSIVGTRYSDNASEKIAGRIAAELSKAGCAIISGMAAGIDRAAHLGALDSGGVTCGVLANGIDIMYPVKNADLFRKIAESGSSSIVSEYPPGVTAGRWTFVKRNRIISGVSSATVVVKAAQKSGAMITAGYAIEQNRELFVCPGYAYDESYSGSHRLIREGAHLLTSADQILEEMGMGGKETQPVQASLFFNNESSFNGSSVSKGDEPGLSLPDLNSEEMKIFAAIGEGEIDADNLIRITGLPSSCIHETLIIFELDGRISRRGNLVSRNKTPVC